MLGFIKKDLLMIKSNLKSILVIVMVFLVVFMEENNLSFIPVFVSVVLFMSTFSYDEYNKWDSYAITLPNGRRYVVISKYLATLVLLFLSLVFATLLSIIVGAFKQNLDMNEIVSLMLGSAFAVILIITIMYPIIFKFGVEKGRIILFISVFGIIGMIALFSKTITFPKLEGMSNILNQYGIIIMIASSILMLFCSYKIAQRIYQKKEF